MAAPQKRKLSDLDPDYDDVDEHQKKRQKLIEATGKEATISKIESILKVQFAEAIKEKEVQINVINQRLSEAQRMLDRLRACIVSSYYAMDEPGAVDYQNPVVPIPIHPTVKKPLAKRPKENPYMNLNGEKPPSSQNHNNAGNDPENTLIGTMGGKPSNEPSKKVTKVAGPSRSKDSNPKYKIIVGNISRYIPIAKREENDPSTHKWMVYVRGPRESADIGHIVKEVWFFLHPSYRPNDLVVVKESPFHLTRRGWGEFPVRVQLHFHDTRNKHVDIIHHLKLDRTYTGLQTLGTETVVEIELESDKKSHDSNEVASTAAKAASTLLNGDGGIVIKTEPMSGSSTPTSLLSPSRIKKEPESPYATPTPIALTIKQEPASANGTPQASPNVKLKAAVTPKKNSTDAGWIQFQICGENVKSSVSSPSPIPQIGSPKPGWTRISDLSSGEDSSSTTKSPAKSSGAATATSISTGTGAAPNSGNSSTTNSAQGKNVTVGTNSSTNQQAQLKRVSQSVKVANTSAPTPATASSSTSSSAAQLVYVKCIDKSGMALLTPKQVQNSSGTAARNTNDVLLKVASPRSSKGAAEIPSKSSTSTPSSKAAVTLAALPKNTTLVYCSSKVAPQTGTASPQGGNKKATQVSAATPSPGNVALVRGGQYFIQYPASVMSSANSTSILRPRLPGASPVLQSVSVPTVRPGGVGSVQNVILTKPGTGKPALQSILTSPSQGAGAKDPKKQTIAIVVSSPGAYVVGKPTTHDKKAVMDGQTTVTAAQPNALGNILLKQPQQAKTISLLRPGLLQTKVGAGSTPRPAAPTAGTLPVNLGPGQIALIASPNSSAGTVVHQAVQISQAGAGVKAGELRTSSTAACKPQSSVLYIVPTSSTTTKASTTATNISSIRAPTMPSHSILGPIKKAQPPQCSPADLIPKFESYGVKKFEIEDMRTMEALVRYTVKLFPLVAQNPDRHAHPYCAPGYAEFLKWNIAKQRAAEWTRACAVRKAIVYLMVTNKFGDTFRGEKLWSRRQIVIWCRKHRFTPEGDMGILPNRDARYGFSSTRLKSVTDHGGVMNKLDEIRSGALNNSADGSDGEEIDIISETPATKPIEKFIKEEPKSPPPASTSAADNANPNMVGDILMRVAGNFVEDLIRDTAANMHDEGFPSFEIGAIDIFNYVKKGNVYDFLTNNHMGINIE